MIFYLKVYVPLEYPEKFIKIHELFISLKDRFNLNRGDLWNLITDTFQNFKSILGIGLECNVFFSIDRCTCIVQTTCIFTFNEFLKGFPLC